MLNIENIEKLSHLSFAIRNFLKLYPWKNCKPKNSTNLKKKISECNVAIVSSAGLINKLNHLPFDQSIKFGDTSFRVINSNVEKNDLKEYHRSDTFDHSNIKSDPFSVLPIPHLFDLVKEGFIKSVNDRHISLMGSIISPSKLINKSIPKIIEIFSEDKVDIAIFIPV